MPDPMPAEAAPPPPPLSDDALAIALLTQNMERIQECAREKQQDFVILRESMRHPYRVPTPADSNDA